MSIADEYREEGKREGKQEGKIEVALEMLRHGLPTDLILEVTGLNRSQLVDLEITASK